MLTVSIPDILDLPFQSRNAIRNEVKLKRAVTYRCNWNVTFMTAMRPRSW